MAYNKTNWQSLPSTDTPISTGNLNKIENGIYDNSLKADQVGDLTQLDTTEKSTLVGAINENVDNISKIGKKLWEGTFTSGSISVPGANNYTFYIVWLDIGTYGIACIGTKAYGIGGIGQYGSYSSAIYSYRLAYNSTNETFSITNVDYGGADGSSNVPIKAIYGLF